VTDTFSDYADFLAKRKEADTPVDAGKDELDEQYWDDVEAGNVYFPDSPFADEEDSSSGRAKALASRKRDSGDTVGDHGSDATSSTGA
jgi:hypothetical protein